MRKVSIHAPLTGSDFVEVSIPSGQLEVSIHAPLTGSDLIGIFAFRGEYLFQSTPPSQGATSRHHQSR